MCADRTPPTRTDRIVIFFVAAMGRPNMRKTLLLLGVVSVLVAACATTVHYPEEARQDWIVCTSQIDADPSYGIGPLAQVARNMAYDRCMQNRGWQKTEPNS